MNRLLCAALPVALATLSLAPPALAADYDPPLAVEDVDDYVPVEVGNGWYLRGDIGYKINTPYRDVWVGPSPIYSQQENILPISGSVGFGYRFNDWFRMEGNLGLMTSNSSRVRYLTDDGMGNVVSAVDMTTENRMWTGMINAYADLGTFAGFTPYVGAGIGLANNLRKFRATENFVDPGFVDIDFRDNKDQYELAYSLGAGINYQVTKNVSVDLGYEYFLSPNAEQVTVTSPTTYAIHTGVDYHQVKLGVRYSLW